MEQCSRFGKWFRSCHFEPRYDIGAPTVHLQRARGCPPEDVAKILRSSSTKTYAGDVCTTCGAFRPRPPVQS